MNRSKRKGTAFETAVVEFLRAHGFPRCERRALAGAVDRGDLVNFPITVEIKNCREMDLAGWCDEAQREAIANGTWGWGVVHKRRMKATRDAYVTLPLWYFAALMQGESAKESA